VIAAAWCRHTKSARSSPDRTRPDPDRYRARSRSPAPQRAPAYTPAKARASHSKCGSHKRLRGVAIHQKAKPFGQGIIAATQHRQAHTSRSPLVTHRDSGVSFGANTCTVCPAAVSICARRCTEIASPPGSGGTFRRVKRFAYATQCEMIVGYLCAPLRQSPLAPASSASAAIAKSTSKSSRTADLPRVLTGLRSPSPCAHRADLRRSRSGAVHRRQRLGRRRYGQVCGLTDE